jgi:alpha-tubulin suppressor-like RCC1 family protein
MHSFAGSGLDFTLQVRDNNVFAQGGNQYGQLGCGDLQPRETEEFVDNIAHPVRSVYAGLSSCFA